VRSLIGICGTVGLTIGSFVPALWGAGQLSLSSLVFGAAGGVGGVWLAVRLLDV